MTIDEYRKKLYAEIGDYCQKYNNLDSAFFECQCHKMLSFMEEQNKKANIFESPTNKDEHQHFWEVLVGNVLLEKKYNPQRNNRDGAPDYFFEQNGIKIHVEAKAPTEGIIERFKPKEIPMINAETVKDENSFQSGIIDGKNCILRFTSILKSVTEQINTKFYRLGNVLKEDKIIVAINGSNVVKNTEIHTDDFRAGYLSYGFNIFCALYGLDGEEYYLPDKNMCVLNEACVMKDGKAILNRFFCPENDTPIDGIIYSNANIENCLQSHKPFYFYQNPNKEDVSHYFPFCKKINPPVRYTG